MYLSGLLGCGDAHAALECWAAHLHLYIVSSGGLKSRCENVLIELSIVVQVAIAVVYCLLAAGIVFGYAALKPVLIREGVYREYCTEDELKEGVRTCFEQEIHLNLMFTIAAVGTNVAALPIGSILDNFGPRVAGIIGSIFLAVGATLFAFADELPFDGFIPGYLLLALGGAFFLITSYQLSNTFPKHSGLILALLTGK